MSGVSLTSFATALSGYRLFAGCALLFAGCTLLFAGCTVRSLENTAAERSVNQCESSANCAGGRCVDGRCLAESGDIDRLLIEVVPPMVTSGVEDEKSPSISSVRYLSEATLPERGSDFARGGDSLLNVQLRPIARVTGEVDFANVETEKCRFDELESVKLQVRFTPSEQVLGLSGSTYATEVTKTPATSLVPFNINVPPGYYDVYLQAALSDETCQTTPRLYRRRAIGIDELAEDILIPLALSKPAKLGVRVKWPQQERTLDGWRVAIIDSKSGLVLSTQAELKTRVGDEYVVDDLEYSPVVYASGEAPDVPAETEVLRLSPPEDVVAPTLYAARVGLELFVPNEAQIELEKLPDVVSVVGQVLLNPSGTMGCLASEPLSSTDNPCAVPFSVQIISSAGGEGSSTFNDTIPLGMIASYQRTVETEPDLSFRVDLPVGEYRVIAIPALNDQKPWAIGEDTWLLGSEDREVHGKTVNVRPQALVSGQVLPLGQGTAAGFAVRLTASPKELVAGELSDTQVRASTVLELTRRETVVPRANPATLNADGSFQVFADAGVFHVSVRPEADTGFAWLVRPNVLVQLEGGQTTTDLGAFRLPVPVRYGGTVRSDNLGGQAVADALIRAYVYIDENGNLATAASQALSVLQVAETRSGSDGHFDLLLPSKWTLPN